MLGTMALILFAAGIALIILGAVIFFTTGCMDAVRDLRFSSITMPQSEDYVSHAADTAYYDIQAKAMKEKPAKSRFKRESRNTGDTGETGDMERESGSTDMSGRRMKEIKKDTAPLMGESSRMQEERGHQPEKAAGTAPLSTEETAPLRKESAATAPLNDGSTEPLRGGEDTAPLRTGKETAPLAAGSDTAPLKAEADTAPLRGDSTAPLRDGDDTAPLHAEKDTAPLMQNMDTAPLAAEKDTAPLMQGKDTEPLREGKDTEPLHARKENGAFTAPLKEEHPGSIPQEDAGMQPHTDITQPLQEEEEIF